MEEIFDFKEENKNNRTNFVDKKVDKEKLFLKHKILNKGNCH